MLDSLTRWLFDSSGLTPHGFCLLWEPGLIWTHAAADLAVGLAYFTIPAALAVLARRRRDIVFRPLVWLFAAFILLCGVTHWLDLLTLWIPAYGLQAIVKVATAVVSIATAITLWRLLPQAVALPSSAQLDVANERLALATDCSRTGIWDRDITSNKLIWNDWMYRLYGLDPRIGGATHDAWKRHVHPHDLAATERALVDCIEGTKLFDTEFRVVWDDGSIHHIQAFGRLTRDAAGRALRMVGTNFDVTEPRKLVAELARAAELRAEATELENAIFRNSPDSLFVIRVEDDPAGPAFVYEAFSPAFERLTGMRIEDMVGRRPEECLPPDLAAAALERYRRCMAERSTITAWSASYVLPIGTRDFEGSITPILQPTSGDVVRLVGTMRDVTERHVLEAAVHHGQRMEAIGRLSAGVAHDFNNILQNIIGGLEFVLDEVPEGAPAHQFADAALNSAVRGSSLTHQLLSYARKQLLRPEAVVLEPFLAEIQTLLARTLGPQIEIRVRTDHGVTILVDPGQLQTALVNLAINARDAMPQGGHLYINARKELEVDRTWVAIAVTDTGTGIDEVTLAQVMEPFFTTKGPQGSGLGLSMVQGFAEQSGGKVQITSAPGEGTTVELRLPLVASERHSAAQSDDLSDLSAPLRMLGRILLVDDSSELLMTIGASLEKTGFAVTRADSGDEALGLLAGEGDSYDAIVSDYVMRGVNGIDLIAAARVIHPGLKAVLITGHSDASKATLPAETLLLHKPFGRDELIDTLKRLMSDDFRTSARWCRMIGFVGLDISLCEREPIHIPGAIQPHGALIAANADGLLISHASANLAAILGRSAETFLGRPLQEAIGDAACRFLQGSRRRDAIALGPIHTLPGIKGAALHLHAHRSGSSICVDVEPMHPPLGQRSPVTLVRSVLETFKQATSQRELCELAVRGLKAITGYDRVMAYRFAEDGHGEVIAEGRATRLKPYLGLRYPASDIPPQARRQYLLNPVGTIADASYQPVPLLADLALDDGTPLDLTYSALRSVSPIHREYMRNMKTAASLTIGLAHGQALWGMLVCHHATPRLAGPELRAVAAMIGQVVSLMLSSLGEAEVYAQQFERIATMRALTNRLAVPLPLHEALAAAAAELLHLVGAGGALVRVSGTRLYIGHTPTPKEAEQALAVLLPAAGDDVLAVDNLGLRHSDLAGCTILGSGALLLPLTPGADDVILWFRPELSQTVAWGGNPAEQAASNTDPARISPRSSFAAWKETVRGHSLPWSAADLALAGELRTAIAAEVAQRTKAELARLRHYDALTGLPNRSLLQERLVEAERGAGTNAALLFLDLDRFKAVNDTMGHAAGDALLVEVARRLLVAAGPETLVARLGGDEFVVLCRGLDREALTQISERIRRAVEAPFEICGRSCHVSASIGIAVADLSGGLDLVRAADMAMYAAKQCGGNRGMVYEPSLHDRAAHQFELDHDLREALGRDDQLVLLYQPLFAIVSGTRNLVGFEALLRWRHPRLGWMAPILFIPEAEKLGLILPLGEWVLATALRQGRVLQQAHPNADLRMAVNVSALQLAQSGFCSGLAETLQAEGFPAAALCLEVTESMLTDVAAAYVLADVRKLGVTVAVDDFGIGYSSLSYLRRLPANVVKLDRSFLEDVENDARGADFVGAVIALAHAAGMSVVMEGIETPAQLEIALAAGADVLQGFLLGRPLSADAAAALAATAYAEAG